MAMTYDPSDKFAFLYSGRTDLQSMHSLREVYELLTKFCNYPAGNVKLIIGGDDTSLILNDCAYESVSDVTGFRNKFYEFASLVNSRNTVTDGISNPVNTVLLYFTGTANTTNPDSITYDLIEGTTPVSISGSVFRMSLRGFNPSPDPLDPSTVRKNYILNSYVNLFFDLNSAGGLDTFITGLDGDLTGTKTFSCSSGETSSNDSLSGASRFSYNWCRAFKMVPCTIGANTYYADSMITTAPAELINNELVSFRKACEYGKLELPATPAQNPSCVEIGTGPFYLGLPHIVIRDGTPSWQSPDIKLRHPGVSDPTDQYIDDYETDDDPGYLTAGYVFKNHIYVNVWNFGTHPVIHLKCNVILYATGCGGIGTSPTAFDDDLRSNNDFLVPISSSGTVEVAFETDNEDPAISYVTGVEYVFDNVPFLTDVHRCIRAKTVWGPAALPAMDDWDYISRDNEAQRNINKGTISSSSGGKKAEEDIKGIIRKKFVVRNPFKKKKLFRVIHPPIPELEDMIEIKIFRSGIRIVEPKKLIFSGINYFDVILEGEAEAEFIIEVKSKVNIRAFEIIELPVEIMVADKSATPEILKRNTTKMPGFVTLAGFTLVLTVADSNLNIQIMDEKGIPAPLTKVIIESADKLHRVELKTDKNGLLRLEGINPVKYIITVVGKTGKSAQPVFTDLTFTPNRLMRLKFKKSLLG